jgi:signal transduction histidine kinase
MNKSKGASRNGAQRDICLEEDTLNIAQTFQPELQNRLSFLLQIIQQQTLCSNCGVFVFEEKENGLRPFLLLNESKSFSDKIAANWKKIGNEVLADGKHKTITGEEVLNLVPLKIKGDSFGLLVNSFPVSDEKSLSKRKDLTILWADILLLIFENHYKSKEIEQTNKTVKSLIGELSQLNQLKVLKELVDGIAHDINNPLQVILGKTQILLMKTSNDPEYQKMTSELGIIERNAERISALLTELSNFVRSIPADVESKSDVNLNYLLNRTISLVKNRFKAKGIELNFQTQEDLPSICGNFFSLQQAFLDLMLNAQEAMPQGGEFLVKLEKKDNFVQLQFQDTGEKIPEHLLSQSFDPSFIHPELKRKIGWGLNSSYQVIKRHHGEIEVKNKENGGAIFSVRLPII